MTDIKIKHLDYIQQTITRMATVSFQVKAWNIGLVTAILAFAAKDRDASFLWVALLPAVMLWFLDSFFLRQERLYRALYDAVRTDDPTIDDLSMNTHSFVHKPFVQRLTVMFSETLLCFHGTVLAVVVVAMLLLHR
jgi:hypothetical protein